MGTAISATTPAPCYPQRAAILAWLAEAVPPARLEHILRVEALSMTLAQQHHGDVQQAGLAGLAHDLAKCFSKTQLLRWAQAASLELTDIDYEVPHLLHADVGALVAQAEFGIDDPAILQAIANHTLGRPEMDDLSCIVFLADALEPGRGDTPALNHLRSLSQQDLAAAVYATCNYSLEFLLAQDRLIHPRTIATRNGFRRRRGSTSPSITKSCELTHN